MSDYNDLIKGAPRLLGLSFHDVLESANIVKEGLKERLKIKDPSPEVVLDFTRLVLERESDLFTREQLDEEFEDDEFNEEGEEEFEEEGEAVVVAGRL